MPDERTRVVLDATTGKVSVAPLTHTEHERDLPGVISPEEIVGPPALEDRIEALAELVGVSVDELQEAAKQKAAARRRALDET